MRTESNAQECPLSTPSHIPPSFRSSARKGEGQIDRDREICISLVKFNVREGVVKGAWQRTECATFPYSAPLSERSTGVLLLHLSQTHTHTHTQREGSTKRLGDAIMMTRVRDRCRLPTLEPSPLLLMTCLLSLLVPYATEHHGLSLSLSRLKTGTLHVYAPGTRYVATAPLLYFNIYSLAAAIALPVSPLALSVSPMCSLSYVFTHALSGFSAHAPPLLTVPWHFRFIPCPQGSRVGWRQVPRGYRLRSGRT